MEEMKAKAKEAGLWNLFFPDSGRGGGLSNLEYAPCAGSWVEGHRSGGVQLCRF